MGFSGWFPEAVCCFPSRELRCLLDSKALLVSKKSFACEGVLGVTEGSGIVVEPGWTGQEGICIWR